jgi:hypothetical protein
MACAKNDIRLAAKGAVRKAVGEKMSCVIPAEVGIWSRVSWDSLGSRPCSGQGQAFRGNDETPPVQIGRKYWQPICAPIMTLGDRINVGALSYTDRGEMRPPPGTSGRTRCRTLKYDY